MTICICKICIGLFLGFELNWIKCDGQNMIMSLNWPTLNHETKITWGITVSIYKAWIESILRTTQSFHPAHETNITKGMTMPIYRVWTREIRWLSMSHAKLWPQVGGFKTKLWPRVGLNQNFTRTGLVGCKAASLDNKHDEFEFQNNNMIMIIIILVGDKAKPEAKPLIPTSLLTYNIIYFKPNQCSVWFNHF